uniref:Uncharacterized protein n=1 Tax=Rhizophora mucronata TaxID=61149 RepID=A0A2P2P1L3_RHIMU
MFGPTCLKYLAIQQTVGQQREQRPPNLPAVTLPCTNVSLDRMGVTMKTYCNSPQDFG